MTQKDKKTNVIEVPSFYINKFDKNSKEVFEYRKEMATTQAISEDLELDKLIIGDMSKIWNEVGGQEGMYDNFPITTLRRESPQRLIYQTETCFNRGMKAARNLTLF